MRWMLGRVTVVVVAVAVISALAGSTAGAVAGLDRIGAAPALPPGAHTIAALPTSKPLPLTIALQPQAPAALAALASAVSTPGSPQFRHYLSVSEFAQQFGATPSAISAVSAALRAQGMHVGQVTANRLTIPVVGTTAQVEQAFSVSESQVRLASGRVAYANAQAPTLESSVAKYVQGVIGLDDVTLPQPAGIERLHGPSALKASTLTHARSSGSSANVVTGGPQPCGAATNAAQGSGYTADIFASAYQFASLYQAGDKGAGQTVALIEEIPYDSTDVGVYAGCYGISPSISNVDVDGGPGAFQQGVSDDGESALDIETVLGLAPSANILVYQGPETTSAPADILSAIVSQDRAKVISTSFGVCEAATGGSVISSENTLLQEAAVQGQSFFSASGDSGSETCSQLGTGNFGLSVEDPAAQPFATGVGGTTTFSVSNGQPVLDTTGAPPTESLWNNGPNPKCNCTGDTDGGGSGGGLSSQWPMPSYQSGAPSSLGVIGPNSSGAPCGSSECREVPDVSADADDNTGYTIYANGGWLVVGGTSAASPLWAAFTALVNAQAACRGLTIGFANPALYQIAGSSYLDNFHDVGAVASPITGATTNDTLDQFGVGNRDPNFLYPQGTGYDMATGLGTPIGSALAGTLCSVRAPVYSVSVASPGSQLSIVSHALALQVVASDSGAQPVSYSASGLPAGLSINASTGVISGTPTTTGASTVTVAAEDQFTNAGSTQFSWTIVQPGRPAVSGMSLSGLSNGKPKLSLTVKAGSFAPALHSITISLPSGLSFSSKAKSLKKGIKVKGGLHFKAKVSGGKLTITFANPVAQATVTISGPELNESGKLAGNIATLKHKHKKLTFSVKLTDASGAATRITIKSKP